MSHISHLILAAFCAAVFLSVSFAAYGLLATPSQTGRRLGILGLMRVRSLERNDPWAMLEPLVRWVAARINPFLLAPLRAKIDRQIVLAGDFLGLQAEEYLALCVLSSIVGTAIGAAVSIGFDEPAVIVVLAGVFGAAVPYFHISGEANTRLTKIQRSLPYAIDLISLSLTAGLDFPGALRQVLDKASNRDDYLMREFEYILRELDLGKTRKEALLQFSARAPGESVFEFVSAIVQAEERGNPLADVLMIQAESARQRRSVRGEESAAKAGVTMIVPCLCIFACVVLLIAGPMFLGITTAFGAH